MASLLFTPGFISVFDNASPSKEFRWLASVFCGIIMCKIVYDITATVSFLCFKGYGNLSYAKKVEWNNRGFSTFHAIVVAFSSLYLLLLSDLFKEDYDELIINRTSAVSETILGISLGYFFTDLAMIIWQYPALGGLEYVLHHGLSMYSIILALISGQAQIYILMVLFSECTTPFVNLRWYLDVAGQKNSTLYVFNGIALFLGWLIARVILFIYLFIHMAIHFDQVKQVFPLGFYCLLTVSPVLFAMNSFWFWKIAKGLIKTLSKARHTQ
ncbi:hypothetical protein Q3G72_033772 [Acer saccharum]|nr:hypothetical protein Q3G72_033772 [Acer saccharum]